MYSFLNGFRALYVSQLRIVQTPTFISETGGMEEWRGAKSAGCQRSATGRQNSRQTEQREAKSNNGNKLLFWHNRKSSRGQVEAEDLVLLEG